MASRKARTRANRKAFELLGHKVTLLTGELVTIVKVLGDLSVVVDRKGVSKSVGNLTIKEAANG